MAWNSRSSCLYPPSTEIIGSYIMICLPDVLGFFFFFSNIFYAQLVVAADVELLGVEGQTVFLISHWNTEGSKECDHLAKTTIGSSLRARVSQAMDFFYDSFSSRPEIPSCGTNLKSSKTTIALYEPCYYYTRGHTLPGRTKGHISLIRK